MELRGRQLSDCWLATYTTGLGIYSYCIWELGRSQSVVWVDLIVQCNHWTIWDLPGSENYNQIRPLGYPGTDVFLLYFAVDESSYFENMNERWYPELNHHCPGTPIILVWTKEDLRDDSEVISHLATRDLSPITYQQGLECARDIGAVRYMECSALTEKGVQEVFIEGARAALRVKKPAQHHVPSRKCSFLWLTWQNINWPILHTSLLAFSLTWLDLILCFCYCTSPHTAERVCIVVLQCCVQLITLICVTLLSEILARKYGAVWKGLQRLKAVVHSLLPT